MKRLGKRELERRHLGDEHVDVVADRVDQRPADVAGRRRVADIRRLEHRRDQRRDGGLAVGAGDRDDRRGRPVRPRDRSRSGPGYPRFARGDERGVVEAARAGSARPGRRRSPTAASPPHPGWSTNSAPTRSSSARRARCRSEVTGASSNTTTSDPSARSRRVTAIPVSARPITSARITRLRPERWRKSA